MRHLLIILAAVLFSALVAANDARAQDAADRAEEITVQITLPDVGGIVMPAMIQGEVLYVPAADLFTFLRIRVDSASESGLVGGYFLDQGRRYLIDGSQHTIAFDGKQHEFGPEGIMVAGGRVFVRTDLFGAVFGLHCAFNFRTLEVTVVADDELPALRDMKREHARRMMAGLTAVPHYDRSIGAARGLVRAGVADWSISGTSNAAGERRVEYALGVGAGFLGGDLEARIHSTSDTLPTLRSIPWRWRYVDNDFAFARQISVGHIATPLPEPVHGSILGAHITNTSPLRRSIYGSYVVQDHTEPGWTVELYVDDRLADVATADSSGIYRFELPLRYGATGVMLKFYGPFGEEESMRRWIRVPYSFLPAGEVEYTLDGGLLEPTDAATSHLFGQGQITMGVTNGLTLGGGVMAIGTTSVGMWHPYVSGAMRIADAMIVSGRFTATLGGEASLNVAPTYRSAINLIYSDHLRSIDGSRAGSERQLGLDASFPLDAWFVHGWWQMHGAAVESPDERSVQADAAMTVPVFGMPLTLGANATINAIDSLRLATLGSTIRFTMTPFQLAIIHPRAEYDWVRRRLTTVGIDMERQITSGLHAELSMQRDMVLGATSAQFGLRVDMPFARASATVTEEDGGLRFGLGTSGSVAIDAAGSSVLAKADGALERGSVAVRPFLDLNNNDLYDDGEPLAADLDVTVNSGTVRRRDDSMVRVLDLEPYVPHVLTMDDSRLPNVSWRAKYRTWEVTPQPDAMQRIDVPIVVAGEASGTVTRRRNGASEGLAGVTVRFERIDSSGAVLATGDSTISYDGGEFDYMGLAPGRYRLVMDHQQMNALGLAAADAPVEFEVRAGMEGDMVEGLQLRLASEGGTGGRGRQ